MPRLFHRPFPFLRPRRFILPRRLILPLLFILSRFTLPRSFILPLLFTLLVLFILPGCERSSNTPFYSASFATSIDGSTPWAWDFSNQTANELTFTQSYYTGSLTAGRQTRWTLSLVDPYTPANLTLTFPGIDSSSHLPTGKDMAFSYGATQAGPPLLECSFFEKGNAFMSNDSIFLDIQFSTFSRGIVTGSFTMQTYGLGGDVTFTDGHFSNIPVTFANP